MFIFYFGSATIGYMLDKDIERKIMTDTLWVEVLTWRNDPLVYAWNRTNRVISLDEHITWFENRQDNLEHEPIFAYFSKSIFVGSVRLDRSSTNTYEISLIVNPCFRGVGFGKAILGNLCTFLSGERWKSFNFVAYIHSDNKYSNSLFESFGFVFKSKVGLFDILQWVRPEFPKDV